MNLSLSSGIVMLLVSIGYLVMTLLLPDATVGKYPYEPKIFPMILAAGLLLLSCLHILSEFKKIMKSGNGFSFPLKPDPYMERILIISGMAVVYALLFRRAGYVISTFLFLEGVLVIFNGVQKWKTNTIVALIFSVVVYIIFAKILNVYLPVTPFLEI